MRHVQGVVENEGVVEVPDCDQNGGSEMEAELYGNELGVKGDLHATKGKGSMNGVSDFEEIIQDIDEAIQYDHRSSNSNEDNPYILLVQEGSKALREVATIREGDSELNTQLLEAMGALDLGTPCTTSTIEMDSNMGWVSNVMAEGGSKGKSTMNNNIKGTLRTKGRPRNKKVEHARAVLKNPGRGRGQNFYFKG